MRLTLLVLLFALVGQAHLQTFTSQNGEGADEDRAGELQDAAYFSKVAQPEAKPIPKPFGVETGIIPGSAITASSYCASNSPLKARGKSGGGWLPAPNDGKPWIQVDLGKPMDIHGIGTKGHYSLETWVTRYTVDISDDGINWRPLLNTRTRLPRVFIGNKNQDEWHKHCLHRYYGCPPTARYVRFNVVKGAGMRVELYGFRDTDDADLLRVLEKDVLTKSTSGCRCYFNPLRMDCACCMTGAVQCDCDNRHQCVPTFANRREQCGIPEIAGSYDKIDADIAEVVSVPCVSYKENIMEVLPTPSILDYINYLATQEEVWEPEVWHGTGGTVETEATYAPESDVPAPISDAPESDSPAPVSDSPAPVTDSPASDSPAPVSDAPAPVTDAPESDSPSPIGDSPAPVSDAPASDSPAPVSDPPAPFSYAP